MWTSIIVKMVTSEGAKLLIAMLLKKLLNSTKTGVTKDIAEVMLDSVALSRANNAPIDAFDVIKKAL
jgi:hypothetical protein